MCVCDELEHSLKCGGCAKLKASDEPIVSLIDKQEYNGDGFPLVKLVKGRLDNVERNIVLFDSSRPFFTKLKSGFREIIIQRGDGSMVTIVKKLFDEGVFPPNETFNNVFAKVLEDYIHGLLWGVLIKIYEAKNTTQYSVVPFLIYSANYRKVFNTGFLDAKVDDLKLSSRLTVDYDKLSFVDVQVPEECKECCYGYIQAPKNDGTNYFSTSCDNCANLANFCA